MFEVGDVIENVGSGSRRLVVGITPAGAMGTRESDGPTYHAVVIRYDDEGKAQAVRRGHSIAIWSGSMSNPTRNWKVVPS